MPGRKRAATVPSGVIRNFSKFHWMSPASPAASGVRVSSPYSGCRPSPLTSSLSSIGKVTPYVVEQKVEISSDEPGSWPPNWLQGTPRTVKPREEYFFCRFSRPSYCGVRPHFEATFTTRTALPL